MCANLPPLPLKGMLLISALIKMLVLIPFVMVQIGPVKWCHDPEASCRQVLDKFIMDITSYTYSILIMLL